MLEETRRDRVFQIVINGDRSVDPFAESSALVRRPLLTDVDVAR
jgi:hypothetical protein